MPVRHPLEGALARSLAEAAPDALLLVNGQREIVFVNTKGQALFGYSEEELVGQKLDILVPEAQREKHIQLHQGYVQSPRFRAMGDGLTLSARHRDGSLIPVEITLSPVDTPLGHFTAAAVRDISSRLAAERALRDAEELFRLTFEEAPIGMALADPQGRLFRANHALCRMLGYSPAELSALTFLDITHPEDRDLHLASLQRIHERAAPSAKVERRYLHKDGHAVQAVLSMSNVYDAQGRLLYRIAQIEDISEQRRAEAARQQSEAHFRAMLELAPDAIIVANVDSGVVEVNSAACQLFGYPRDEFLARGVFDLVAASEVERLQAIRQSLLIERGTHCGEWLVRHKDGSVFPTEVSANILPDGRWQAIVRDIRARKQLEHEREESLRWLHEVLAQCPVGIVLCHQAVCERCDLNRHARHLLGMPEGSPPPPALVFADDSGVLPDEQHPITRALRGERLSGLMLSLQRLCGEFVPVLVDAAPIRSADDGPVRGAIIVFQDITVLKQLDRLRAEWNAVIAHDLRQPLNAIALNAQLIARKKKDGADVGRPVEQITASARRLNRMINDLLDLSRLEARQLKLVRQPVDLGSLVHVSIERMAAEAPDRAFEVRIPAGLPFVDVDADRIMQVLDNLLSNAIKYGTAETPIEIDIALRELELVVAVINQGPGIAPEDLPHLFQRFHRVGKESQRHIKGVGLGLYIVQQLIEAHGGRVQAESMPGGKTIFRFSLPRSARELPRSDVASDSSS